MTAQREALRAARLPKSCHYCSTPLSAENRTKDHIVPKSKGGSDSGWNIVWACQPCNTAKKAEWPADHCRKCKQAKWRFANSPVSHLSKLTRSGIGPRCRTCGEVTISPDACVWCATA